MAIKLSVLYEKIKKELKEVKGHLDLWKNNVSTTNFPTDFCIEFIRVIILRYYVERISTPLNIRYRLYAPCASMATPIHVDLILAIPPTVDPYIVSKTAALLIVAGTAAVHHRSNNRLHALQKDQTPLLMTFKTAKYEEDTIVQRQSDVHT